MTSLPIFPKGFVPTASSAALAGMTVTRRALTLSGLVLPLLLAAWPGAGLAAVGGDLGARASGFVDDLGRDAVAIMATKHESEAQRVERYRVLLQRGFDVPTIARFALGRYWTLATPAQQRDYQHLFEEMVVRTYALRFDAYNGQTLRVLSSRPEGATDVVVVSQVDQPGGPPIALEWRVREREGRLGVVDVVVEGVSMSVSQRQEFAAAIQAKGGNIDAFLQALRDKNAALAGPSSPGGAR